MSNLDIYSKIAELAKVLVKTQNRRDAYYDHIFKDERFIIYWKLKRDRWSGESLIVYWKPDKRSRDHSTIISEQPEKSSEYGERRVAAACLRSLQQLLPLEGLAVL